MQRPIVKLLTALGAMAFVVGGIIVGTQVAVYAGTSSTSNSTALAHDQGGGNDQHCQAPGQTIEDSDADEICATTTTAPVTTTNAPVTTTTTTTTVPTTATTVPPTSPGTPVAVSPTRLAFTGPPPGLWWLALVGLAMTVLGAVLLTNVGVIRRLTRAATHWTGRTRGRA